MADTLWLDYHEAAKRVGRSTRNIRRWHAEGMPMRLVDGQRFVDEKVLLAWWRERMKASPVHYYRLRAAARADGRPDPLRQVIPDDLSPSRAPRPVPTPDTPTAAFEPLETMRPMRGGPEYRQLHKALQYYQPGCRDIDAFTAERIDDDTAVVLARICDACPVRELCAAFVAVGRPGAGFWAGAVVV